MLQITLNVDGMMCGMCESHINNAVRGAFHVRKVTSSHTKGQTVIITEKDIDDNRLREVIGQTGYELSTIDRVPYEKKSCKVGLNICMRKKR
jgi:copper chaperone CopZ